MVLSIINKFTYTNYRSFITTVTHVPVEGKDVLLIEAHEVT